MRRPKIGSVLCAIAIATATAVPILAAPAGATVADTCTDNVHNAGISQYPNDPGGQSTIRVSCTFSTATATSSVFWKLEDSPEAVWHPGAARTVSETSSTTNTITSAAGHFSNTKDVNHPISGPGIPGRAFIISVSGTTATLNVSGVVQTLGATLTVENSSARSVADATFSGSVITSSTAHFTSADAGRIITATQIPPKTFLKNPITATTATLSAASTACNAPAVAADCMVAEIDPPTTLTTDRQVDDASASGAVVTSVQAGFQASDIELQVTGTNVPAGDYITAVSGNTATLNVAPTGAVSVLTIGQPNANAPANGDQAAQLGAELALNPHLVQGSPDCSLNQVQGFAESGQWRNPGSFLTSFNGGGVLGGSTDPTILGAVVAQILYPTSVISFAAYVVKVNAGIGGTVNGETQPLAHYDVVFPLLPTSLAACPSVNPLTDAGTSSSFTFNATTAAIGELATGVGAPTTGVERALLDDINATFKTTSVYFHNATTGAAFATVACHEDNPGIVDFKCGN